MADFSIAAQVGQNAMAPQQGQSNMFNPMNMLQMQQTMQAMALQRAADARAAEQLALQRKQYGLTEESTRQSMGITAAAEERAKALHAPALEVSLAQAAKAKREMADLNTSDAALTYMAKYPDWMTRYETDLRSKEPKVWAAVKTVAEKAAETKLASDKSRIDFDEAKFKLNSAIGNHMVATKSVVRDQSGYDRWMKTLLDNNPDLVGRLPREYSPENLDLVTGIVDQMRKYEVIPLANGTKAVYDPTRKTFVADLTQQGSVPRPQPAPQAAPAAAGAAPTRPDAFGPVIENELINRIPGARITGRGRTPERNAEVGGAQRSYHLTNDAIDAAPPAGMPMNVFAEQVRRELGPLGYTVIYGDAKHRDHVHIQPGPGMNVPRASMTAQAAPLPGMAQQAPMGQPGAAPVNALAANPLIAMQMARMMQPQNAMAPQQAGAQPQVGPSGLAAPAPMPIGQMPAGLSPVGQVEYEKGQIKQAFDQTPEQRAAMVSAETAARLTEEQKVKQTPEQRAAMVAAETAARLAEEQKVKPTTEQKAEEKGAETKATKAAQLEVEKAAAKPKVDTSYIAAQTAILKDIRAIDQLLSEENARGLYYSTGPVLGREDSLSTRYYGPANTARALLRQISGASALSALTEMRNNSPTGGALGNVSDKDTGLLQNQTQKLTTTQDTDALKKYLREYRKDLEGSMKRMAEAYKRDYNVDAPTVEPPEGSAIIVQTPKGAFSFPTQAAADAFRKKAGL